MSEERRAAVVEMTGEELANRLGLAGTVKVTRARVVETEDRGVMVYLRCVGEGCPVVPSGKPPETVPLDSLRVPEVAPTKDAPKAAGKPVKTN